MYYKLTKDGRVIDVLEELLYAKKHPEGHIVVCGEMDAQLILGSDFNTFYHASFLNPIDGYEPIDVEPIDEFEYAERSKFMLDTRQDIIDATIASLLEEGVI